MLSKISKKIFGSFIPVLNINGQINGSMTQNIQKKLQKVQTYNAVALAVSINSTGGSAVHSQIIAKKLKNFAKQNNLKLYTFGRKLVTSSGYLILAAGDQIYCDESSIIGNIGVFHTKYSLNDIISNISLQHKLIYSNKNLIHDKLHPLNQMSTQEKKRIQEVFQKMHNQLVKEIKLLRGNKLKSIDPLFNGLIYLGQESKQLGLVDGLGSYIQILEQKYPGCKLGIQKQKSIWNTFLQTY